MTVADRVELAHEPDFVLGRLTVSPSRRELVRDDGEREVIEHRMMRVLIALSKASWSYPGARRRRTSELRSFGRSSGAER